MYGADTWDTSESESEIHGNFQNVVPEKDRVRNEGMWQRLEEQRSIIHIEKEVAVGIAQSV